MNMTFMKANIFIINVKAPANSVPAAAVRRKEQAYYVRN